MKYIYSMPTSIKQEVEIIQTNNTREYYTVFLWEFSDEFLILKLMTE